MDLLVPTAVHHKRTLVARQESESQCDSADPLEDYNLGLHIFAVFLILLCGSIACLFPTIVKIYPQLAISKRALFVCRHFGTGVFIALAFCHLLPTAFENLWDECLAYFWREGYSAMPGFLAMTSALATMLIEMGSTFYGFKHVCCADPLQERVEGCPPDAAALQNGGDNCYNAAGCTTDGGQHIKEPGAQADGTQQSSTKASSTQTATDDEASNNFQEPQLKTLGNKQLEQRLILQCLLLEGGILFHSVFIGLSISLSTGTDFIALMVAIAFHQIFEGLALGARIAAIPSFKISSFKPWLMAVAYGFTCPLGQIIGLGVRNSYNPEGTTGLLVVGIANAISAGLIMYAGLVQLLGEELLSEKSYSKYTFRARIEAVISLILGTLLMAMIAIWA